MRNSLSFMPANELEIRLKGTHRAFVLRELFTNSLHFPLANIFLELLLEGPQKYLMELALYALIAAGLIQAYVIGTWKYRGHSRPFLGNMIGPSLYTIVELSVSGWQFFSSPYHVAYWGFSLLIGSLQHMRFRLHGRLFDLCLLLEHFIRTNILLVTYWIFETLTSPGDATLFSFLDDSSHVFIAIVIPLLGILVGFSNITATHYLSTLRQTAKQLRKYSEWFIGRDLLSQAVTDPEVLTLKRRERTVMFMDIRGFTSWSETKTPEEVVMMLNEYFAAAERLWKDSEDVIKVKHTGDEILAVFSSAKGAVDMALKLCKIIELFLAPYHLSAGIGIHSGQLVEGLIGSPEVKAYDIIGDTVNTSKRLCDSASGGEVLVSQSCYDMLNNTVQVVELKHITVKGKREALKVYSIQELPE